MFENILGKSKDPQIAYEKRQEKFLREQMALKVGESDDTYLRQQMKNDDLLRWQQDLYDELELLKQKLRNKELINGKWQSKKVLIGYTEEGAEIWRDMRPRINETGIQMIESIISPLLSRNIINSNFDEDRILTILKETCNDLVANLAYNYLFFEIEFPDLDVIVRLCKNVIIGAPFRALDDGERKHQRTLFKKVETENKTQHDDDKKRFGLFGSK